jgi:hypothetical protein
METAMLPAKLVPTRDTFLFCCYTGLRYSYVSGLHRGNLHEWNGGGVVAADDEQDTGGCEHLPDRSGGSHH